MMGHVFEQYRQSEGRSEEDLAKELGCSHDVLHRMALCRRPGESRFEEQVTAIATRFEVALLPLVQVLRRVEVIEALAAEAPVGTPEEGEPEAGTSMRVAARDRAKDGETAS
ncbi:hypothetical protein JY651_09625 [Pyxidicoccus parkwayensis]|uniref:HTH cro/C1-type domain-containing protein n=2 Tax=Pyxidicoccus parkwayensis TaxID=2813578 RepID=A0ABX7PC37_9BACT|nr:hypothetical protein JY651_09625 [Pyxidicoccus parkwaysis]